MAVNGYSKLLPYQVVVINQYASRVVREDFINAMAKLYPEGLKEVSQKKVMEKDDFKNNVLPLVVQTSGAEVAKMFLRKS